jgi:hypothetical protein
MVNYSLIPARIELLFYFKEIQSVSVIYNNG